MVFGGVTGLDPRSLGDTECSGHELGLSRPQVTALRAGGVRPAGRGGGRQAGVDEAGSFGRAAALQRGALRTHAADRPAIPSRDRRMARRHADLASCYERISFEVLRRSAAGCLQRDSLRGGGAADEAVAGLGPRGPGRRRLPCRASCRGRLRAAPSARLRCAARAGGAAPNSLRYAPFRQADAESVYEVRCAHRPQPCAARRARCPAKASPSAPGGNVPAGRQIQATFSCLGGGIDEPSRLRQCPRPSRWRGAGLDANDGPSCRRSFSCISWPDKASASVAGREV